MQQSLLKVIGGKQDGNLIPLTTRKFLIGREQDCHLRPGSESVSRHHCMINVDEFGVRIRDLGSSNGTLVNGTRIIGTQEVNTGDRLKIGSLEFELLTSGQEAPVVTTGKGATEFSLDEFELDDASDTAVMSGDTTVLNRQKIAEQSAEAGVAMPAATEVAAQTGDVPRAEAADELTATAQTSAAEVPEQPVTVQSEPVQPAPPQPAFDPAAPMAPQQPGMPYPQQPMPGYPGAPMPGMQQPGMQQPGMQQPGMQQPGYPAYGVQQPGYGMPPQPGYGMPYPQPGYSQPGYPQPMYPQPAAYPGQPAPVPADEEESEEQVEETGDAVSTPSVSLPDPADTGLKDEPKADGGDGGSGGASAPNPAEEVLKKYTNRR